jgi:hypothetical protein
MNRFNSETHGERFMLVPKIKSISKTFFSMTVTFVSTFALADDSSSSVSSSSNMWITSGLLRIDFVQPRLNEKIPAKEVASQTALLDFNLTGKSELRDSLRLQADLDIFARRSWNFKRRNLLTQGIETNQREDSENPAYRLSLNEIYLNGETQEGFQYVFGKKRILWGTGFAANPTDLLNPSKNPLDPSYERRGAWLLQGEYVQESQTFALLVAPGVVEDKNTLPKEVGVFADSNGQNQNHFLLGARWYRLLGGADLNLMAFYSDRFREGEPVAWKGGASWSQIAASLSKQLETHAEILFQRGSSNPLPLGESRLKSEKLFFKTLVGLRYDFENESALVIEYLNQSDGDTVADLQTRLKREFTAVSRSSQSQKGVAEQRILMRNNLYLNYQRYKFNEDIFLSWASAHNLHDHSGFQGPILQWTPSQTLTLSVSASSDYNLQRTAGVQIPGIGYVRTNELNPSKSRLGLEIKSYF